MQRRKRGADYCYVGLDAGPEGYGTVCFYDLISIGRMWAAENVLVVSRLETISLKTHSRMALTTQTLYNKQP